MAVKNGPMQEISVGGQNERLGSNEIDSLRKQVEEAEKAYAELTTGEMAAAEKLAQAKIANEKMILDARKKALDESLAYEKALAAVRFTELIEDERQKQEYIKAIAESVIDEIDAEQKKKDNEYLQEYTQQKEQKRKEELKGIKERYDAELEKLEELKSIDPIEYDRQKKHLDELFDKQKAQTVEKYKFEEEEFKKFTKEKEEEEKAKEKRAKIDKAKADRRKAKEDAKAAKDAANKITDSIGSQMNDVMSNFTVSGMKDLVGNIKDAYGDLKDEGMDSGAAGTALAIKAMASFAAQLNDQIDAIASKKTAIDTRLYGSKTDQYQGSYWAKISGDITGMLGVSPLLKQEDMVKNIEEMVDMGIAYNVEQRAFLATVSDKIATTFNATDGTLLRLVRIQQQDSTAARLGMEAALNEFLNHMYENTEYLKNLSANVRASLKEAESLMDAASATELEYQVQKWMGSLYSVGMSDEAVQSLASSIGKIAAGDISAVTDGGTGNLIVMAANHAGMSIADKLKDGLNATETNQLMTATVEYLAGIYESSSDSKVIQQQIAKVYGMSASDLKAIKNLAPKIDAVASTSTLSQLTYGGMIDNLTTMANSMSSRVSIGEQISNVQKNLSYTMAAGIANSPALYTIYKMAGMLKDTTGGIAIPAISYLGTGFDLETTVAELMQAGTMAGGILGSIGRMMAGGGGLTGGSMLKAMGINGNLTTVQYGSGTTTKAISGTTTSESGSSITKTQGNSEDIQSAEISKASDKAQSQIEALESSDQSDTTNRVIDGHVVEIISLLNDVVSGTKALHIDSGNTYGLSGPNSSDSGVTGAWIMTK